MVPVPVLVPVFVVPVPVSVVPVPFVPVVPVGQVDIVGSQFVGDGELVPPEL